MAYPHTNRDVVKVITQYQMKRELRINGTNAILVVCDDCGGSVQRQREVPNPFFYAFATVEAYREANDNVWRCPACRQEWEESR